jgi:DNA-binding transcriptional MerR regulator
MKVSELAKRAGTTAKAVRFYEAEGVLPLATRAENGYRAYTETDLCRLRVLVSLRALDVPLAESGRLAALCAADRCDEMEVDLFDVVRERRAAVAATRAQLDHLERELAGLEASLAGRQEMTEVCCEGR